MTLDFNVNGIPIPQGSKRWIGNNRMIESSEKELKPWRQAVAWAALKASREQHWTQTDGPLRVTVTFRFPRPVSVKPRKRPWPSVKPDLDKCVRAFLDGITDSNSVWTDDARVVDVHAVKRYAQPMEPPGARILIEPMTAA